MSLHWLQTLPGGNYNHLESHSHTFPRASGAPATVPASLCGTLHLAGVCVGAWVGMHLEQRLLHLRKTKKAFTVSTHSNVVKVLPHFWGRGH